MSLICIRGNVFGKLTVLSRHGSDSTGKTTWLCACECGAETVATGLNLKSGNTKSCGCAKSAPRTRHDISGMRFGHLTVTRRSGSHGGRSQWECICDCGEANYVTYSNLVRGVTRSCGCLQKQNVRSQWDGHVPTTRGTWARHTTNDGICANCGTPDMLHAHHMFPASTHPDMMLDATNGIALCGPCHRAYHSAHKLRDVNPASLCEWIGMDGLISQFFEYFVGYKDKGGIEDLRKAAHCVEMLIQHEMDEAHKRDGWTPEAIKQAAFTSDEWIPTNGQEPDLPSGTLVDAKFLGGAVESGLSVDALLWWHDGASYDITHYRIHQPIRG